MGHGVYEQEPRRAVLPVVREVMFVGLELVFSGMAVAPAIGKARDDGVAPVVMDGDVELGAGIVERDLAEGTAARVLTVAVAVAVVRVPSVLVPFEALVVEVRGV